MINCFHQDFTTTKENCNEKALKAVFFQRIFVVAINAR
jgi:hypothetical protein